MNSRTTTTRTAGRTGMLLLASVALSATANADASRTRSEVQAELAEARRTGQLLGNGESGLLLNELHPQQYPARPAQPSKTRAQVRAELAEAQRTGDLVSHGPAGLKLNELHPHRYPVRPAPAGASRAQVQAELALALRLGDVQTGSDSRTRAERSPERYARVRAEHAARMQQFAGADAGLPPQER